MRVTIPIKVESEANQHTHWRERQRRAKSQRATVRIFLLNEINQSSAKRPALPVVVTMTRIAPRMLDSDNAVGAFKAIRDSIADFLGINDRDPRIDWRVLQEKGPPKTYQTRIEIEEAR